MLLSHFILFESRFLPDFCWIFAGFLPDFCWIFAGFLLDFCRIFGGCLGHEGRTKWSDLRYFSQ